MRSEEGDLSSPAARPFLQRCAVILLTLWAGSLWTVCGLVAPTLFSVLDDRRLAGELAGLFFARVAWLGLAIGILLAVIALSRAWRQGRAVLGLIALAALAPVASELLLGPMMQAARDAGEMHQFALWHGVAGVLFLVACAASFALVLKINRAG